MLIVYFELCNLKANKILLTGQRALWQRFGFTCVVCTQTRFFSLSIMFLNLKFKTGVANAVVREDVISNLSERCNKVGQAMQFTYINMNIISMFIQLKEQFNFFNS